MDTTIANVEMAKAWDGEEGEQWTEHAERFEATGVYIWPRFLEAVAIAPSDRVLDIGCGTGESARDAARIATEGYVLGVDLSSKMLGFAADRCRREGLANVEFIQADAQVHPFEPESFDLAISSYGTMFFNDPVAAFVNIRRALRPGGRLAMLTWQELAANEWLTAIREALAMGRDLPAPPSGGPGPFGLDDSGRIKEVLTAAGFDSVELESLVEPVRMGADVDDAWEFISVMGIVNWMTDGLDDDTRAEAVSRLRATVEAHSTGDGVLFGSASWLVSARRA